jgi:hypothetical protein
MEQLDWIAVPGGPDRLVGAIFDLLIGVEIDLAR